ncbi:MAM and LDL-receptor class A domain-containing protein 1-like [Orbicella faveolata]|uniref:MAM and LDL-receptor class A domain-containing protein 1-like n=1 Tax=Orbicella faveolata TaxID=48498 RepID=UPI0009E51E9B|nr:MAM and LDL-receptor class A domain-containing protein 1-like [Orbicella faveolata]
MDTSCCLLYIIDAVAGFLAFVACRKYQIGTLKPTDFDTAYSGDAALHVWKMVLSRQETFLLFLAYNFVGIKCGSSKETTGNCSFDENTLCSWSNDNRTDHFDWQLRRGSSPSNNTGPTSDHSGDGSYICIDTSLPRKYDEKARLNSPWLRGAQRMTFYYFMYSSTVESLSVYVRSNGSDRDERIWSRYGNHLSSNWTKGCVAVNISGTYQVETFWAKLCGYFFKD